MEELQKAIVDITRYKVNPQEPPSHIPIAISGQPIEKVAQDTLAKVDSTVTITIIAEELAMDQT